MGRYTSANARGKPSNTSGKAATPRFRQAMPARSPGFAEGSGDPARTIRRSSKPDERPARRRAARIKEINERLHEIDREILRCKMFSTDRRAYVERR